MDETLENIEMGIYSFQMMADETSVFMHKATAIGCHQLADDAKKALDGLSGIVSFLAETHSALLEEKGTVRIPVTNGDRPKLTILQGGKSNKKQPLEKKGTFNFTPSPIM